MAFNYKHIATLKIKSILIIFLVVVFSISCTDFVADFNPQDEWNILESEKIVLHFRPGGFSSSLSPNLQQAREILRNQEFYYQVIQDSIKKHYNDRILIYLYNWDEAKELIGTNGGGHSIPKYNTYYYTFIPGLPEFTDQYGRVNPFVGLHELVHIITHRTLGYPGTKLMSEGYAVWLDGSYARKSINDIMRRYRNSAKHKILTPDQLLSEVVDNESVYYPNCGVFIQFLVNTYGIEIINKLFTSKKENYKYDFQKYTGDDWNIMNEEYSKYLKKI